MFAIKADDFRVLLHFFRIKNVHRGRADIWAIHKARAFALSSGAHARAQVCHGCAPKKPPDPQVMHFKNMARLDEFTGTSF